MAFDEPTHEKEGILDVVISGVNSDIEKIAVMKNEKLSDHYPLYVNLRSCDHNNIGTPDKTPEQPFRDIRNFDHDYFRKELINHVKLLHNPALNVNACVVEYSDLMRRVFNGACPLIKKKGTSRQRFASWMSKDAREVKRKLRCYERRMRSAGDETSRVNYKTSRNAYHAKLLSLKNEFYARKVTEAKKGKKKLFSTVK